MIKQISLVAIIAIGIGVLFLGTVIAPVFATVPGHIFTADYIDAIRNTGFRL